MPKDMQKIPHGTSNAYKNYGCRCNACCDAGRQWMRDYYRRTDRLTKMVRTGESMNKGSQGGPGVRGPQQNLGVRRTKNSAMKKTGRKKPEVVEYDAD